MPDDPRLKILVVGPGAIGGITALPGVVENLKPALAPGSRIVSLQNGIVEDIIAGIVGRERTVGCVVGWGATMRGPGELGMTSKGEFIIGRLDGREDELLRAIRDILALVRPTGISSNITGHLYAKLIINSCITTLGAVTGLYLGEMLALRRARELFIEIVREAMAVAAALGIKVEPVARLDFAVFLAGRGPLGDLKRHTLIRLIGLKYRRLKSSSLQSLERGEKTEIDYLNGYIVKKGREAGVPTPLNARLVAVIREIESGTRRLSPDNLTELQEGARAFT